MTSNQSDPANARDTLHVGDRSYDYYRLDAAGARNLERLPYTVKVLLENMLRGAATSPDLVSAGDVRALANWDPTQPAEAELPFMPARVILQDFTGVPCVVDLAAMRDAIAEMGGDPSKINPLVPADLVIDHSVQVDQFGSDAAFLINVDREYERNGERYALLRWAQQAFADFRVVPPGTGIVHQVNLEYLADVVAERDGVLMPDTLVGTDSHTTMINGLGVVGWGVGGIEAEAALLGQPCYQPMPIVVGFRLDGELPSGATATDLVLYVTEQLRAHGVVGKFVEFYGPGLARLGLADRATISNMSPEFGATATLFPVDDETLRYLRMTGRPDDVVARVEAYTRAQGMFRTDDTPDPIFSESLSLDLSTVVPSLAGPKRPQDRVALSDMRSSFQAAFPNGLHSHADGIEHAHPGQGVHGPRGTVDEASDESFPASDPPSYTRDPDAGMHATRAPARHDPERLPADAHYKAAEVRIDGQRHKIRTGSVVIAAITSCTNTSNPSVMVAAGLLAVQSVDAKLLELGLEDAHRSHTRLGVPFYDVDRIIHSSVSESGSQPYGPEGTSLLLAESIKREYAVLNVFSEQIANAHLVGDIHIHGIGAIDRPHSLISAVDYVKQFGMTLPQGFASSRPARRAEVLVAHIVKLSAALQGYLAGPVVWDSLNFAIAPFLEGRMTAR